jgi:hypothetical protein
MKIQLLVYWASGMGFNNTPWLDLFQQSESFELIDERMWEEIRSSPLVVNLDSCVPPCAAALAAAAAAAGGGGGGSGGNSGSGGGSGGIAQGGGGGSGSGGMSIRWLYQGRFRQSSIVTSHALASLDTGTIYKYVPHYDRAVIEWLRSLVPESGLQGRIRELTNTFDTKTTCGVHIRRNDALKGPLKKKVVMTTDDAYFERHIDKHMRLGNRVYLATDDQRLWDTYRSRYGDKIIGQEISRREYEHGEVKNGQRDALVDLFCLSACKEVLGTSHSNFSLVARMLRESGNRRMFDLILVDEKTSPPLAASSVSSASASLSSASTTSSTGTNTTSVMLESSSAQRYLHRMVRVASVFTFVHEKNVVPARFLLETLNFFEPGMHVFFFLQCPPGRTVDYVDVARYPKISVTVVRVMNRDMQAQISHCLDKSVNTMYIDPSVFLINPLPYIPSDCDFMGNTEDTVFFVTGVASYRTMPHQQIFDGGLFVDVESTTSRLNRLYHDCEDPFRAFGRKTRFVQQMSVVVTGPELDKSRAILLRSLEVAVEFEPLHHKLLDTIREGVMNDYSRFFAIRRGLFSFRHDVFNEKNNTMLNEVNAMKSFERTLEISRTTYNFLRDHVLFVCDGARATTCAQIAAAAAQLSACLPLPAAGKVLVYWNERHTSPYNILEDKLLSDLHFVSEAEYRTITRHMAYTVLCTTGCLASPPAHVSFDSAVEMGPTMDLAAILRGVMREKNTLVMVYSDEPIVITTE